jgi:hypothetical protein
MVILKNKFKQLKIVPIVGVEEFYSEPYFVGKSTDKGKKVFGIWRKALDEMFGTAEKTEIILTGAIGIGKSSVAMIAESYIAYRILLMENPHDYFGMLQDDPIVIAFINLTRSLSDSGNVQKFVNLIYNSKAFRDLGTKFSDKARIPLPIFSKGLQLISGSAFMQGYGIVGKNIITGTLDEISDMRDARSSSNKNILFSQKKAMRLYRTIAKRITSRFMKHTELAKLFLISSKQERDQFLEDYRKKVEDMKHVKVYDYALWDAKPTYYKSGRIFYLGVNSLFHTTITKDKRELPKDCKVYKIPLEHWDAFKLDAITALADLGGIGTNANRLIFFRNKVQLAKAFTGKRICREVLEVSLFDKEPILKAFKMEELELLKGKNLYLHIDLSKNQCRTGIAGSTVDSFKMITLDGEDRDLMDLDRSVQDQKDLKAAEGNPGLAQILLKEKSIRIPVVKVEFALALQAKDEIPISKIRDFIYTLSTMGINVVLVTTDGYQSVDMHQLLVQRGYKTELVSLDKTPTVFTTFRAWTYKELVILPKVRLLWNELKALIDVNGKIEHPEDGSKDVADAVAASVWSAITKQSNFTPKDKMALYKLCMGSLKAAPPSYDPNAKPKIDIKIMK